MLKSEFFAILSGTCAAFASIFGKLCGVPVINYVWFVRSFFFCLMLLCNAGVWTFFVKALQHSSSLSATAISSSVNFFISAVVGVVLFEEKLSLWRWSGIGLIVVGLALIQKDMKKVEVGTDDEHKKSS